jgi:hypothetical protein
MLPSSEAVVLGRLLFPTETLSQSLFPSDPDSRRLHQQAKAELINAKLSPIASLLLELLRSVIEKKNRQKK